MCQLCLTTEHFQILTPNFSGGQLEVLHHGDEGYSSEQTLGAEARWEVAGKSRTSQLSSCAMCLANLSSSTWDCRGQGCVEHSSSGRLQPPLLTVPFQSLHPSSHTNVQMCRVGCVSLFLTPARTQEGSQGHLDDPGHHPPRSLPCSKNTCLVRIVFAR